MRQDDDVLRGSLMLLLMTVTEKKFGNDQDIVNEIDRLLKELRSLREVARAVTNCAIRYNIDGLSDRLRDV